MLQFSFGTNIGLGSFLFIVNGGVSYCESHLCYYVQELEFHNNLGDLLICVDIIRC